MRDALAAASSELAPDLEVEGEMHGDAALSEEIREQVFPELAAEGRGEPARHADLDAANIAFNLLKTAAGDGITSARSCSASRGRCTSSRRRRPCAASST